MAGKRSTFCCFPVKHKRKKKLADTASEPLYTDQKESLKKKPSSAEEHVREETALIPKSSPHESPKSDKASIEEEEKHVSVDATSQKDDVQVTTRKSSSSSSSNSDSGSCNSVIEVPKKVTTTTDEIIVEKQAEDENSATSVSQSAAKNTELPKEVNILPENQVAEKTSETKIADNVASPLKDVKFAEENIEETSVESAAGANKSVVPVSIAQLQGQPVTEESVQVHEILQEEKNDSSERVKEDSALSTGDVTIRERTSTSSGSQSSFEILDGITSMKESPVSSNHSMENNLEAKKDKEAPQGQLPSLDVTDGHEPDKCASEEPENEKIQLDSSTSSVGTSEFQDASNYSDVYMSSESIPKGGGDNTVISGAITARVTAVNEVTIVSTESDLLATHRETNEIPEKTKVSSLSSCNAAESVATTNVEHPKIQHNLTDESSDGSPAPLKQQRPDTSDNVGQITPIEKQNNSSSSTGSNLSFSSEHNENITLEVKENNIVFTKDETIDVASHDVVDGASGTVDAPAEQDSEAAKLTVITMSESADRNDGSEISSTTDTNLEQEEVIAKVLGEVSTAENFEKSMENVPVPIDSSTNISKVNDEIPLVVEEELVHLSDVTAVKPKEGGNETAHGDLLLNDIRQESTVTLQAEKSESAENASTKKSASVGNASSDRDVEKECSSQTPNVTLLSKAGEPPTILKDDIQIEMSSSSSSSESSSSVSSVKQDKVVSGSEKTETTRTEKEKENLETKSDEKGTKKQDDLPDQPAPSAIQRKRREDIEFKSGWRKSVKLIDLLNAEIVTERTVESLESGVLDEAEVANNLRQYLEGLEPVAGLLIMESGEKMSLHDATKKRVVRRGTAVSLLEAQAATGSIISPYTGEKMSVEEATKTGLIDKFLSSVLCRAERAACGFNSKLSPKPLSLFEAMKKSLVVESHGIRLLEAQVATGGIIDPRANHRLPAQVAIERGLFDERLNKIIEDPSDETKGFFDPNTNQNLTYMQLLERCVTDEATSLKLLPIYKGKQKKDYWKNSD